MNLRRPFFCLLLLVLLAGCGYVRAGRTTSLLQGRSLHLAMFANRTYQPNIEAEFRKKLLDELAVHGENLAPERSADLLLSGEIESADIATTAFSAADKAMMNSLALTVSLQLTDRQSGKVIWRSTEALRQEYPAIADLGLQRNSRDAAVSALCTRLARVIVEKMDQAF